MNILDPPNLHTTGDFLGNDQWAANSWGSMGLRWAVAGLGVL